MIPRTVAAAQVVGAHREGARSLRGDAALAVQPRTVSCLLIVVAFAIAVLGAWPVADAHAEQGGVRGRSYLGGRMDASANYLGPNHTCAIEGNGQLYCWGSNYFGQLGYGNVSNVGEVNTPGEVGPVDLGPGRTAVAVATSSRSTCAILDNGTVKCWGLAAHGELGYGNTEAIGDNETPATIGPVDLGTGRTAVAIAGGGDHFCAILDNGTVRCWGTGSSGELGYGNTSNIGDNETPGSVGPVDLGAGRTAIAITAGTLHTCAILDIGQVRCWGHNTSGELGIVGGPYIGDNETPGSVSPVELGGGRTATAISAGESNTCAILDNGALKCWGSNEAGKLGYGNTQSGTLPASVGTVDLGIGRTAVAVTTGPVHTCVTLDNGQVRCWGSTEWGELGLGNTPTTGGGNIGDNETPSSVPPVEVGAGRRALTVSAGSYYTCAMLDDGTLRCWGSDTDGRLGYALGSSFFGFTIGDDETPGSMGPVDLGTNHGALEAVAGGTHSCALFDAGTIRCWGNAADGQLGYGNTNNIGDNENVGAAGLVNLGGSATEMVAGANHTCALLSDGTVRCWGLASNGQLGYGNTNTIGDNETPASAGSVNLDGKTAMQVAAGANHTCALLSDGTVRCWGLNSSGQLGYGNTNTIGDNETPGELAPVNLGEGKTAVSISAGGSHTCAQLSDGTIRCWGNGASGRLGYSNTTTIGDNETPSGLGAVGVSGSARDLVAGGSHTCTTLTTGTVRCWGLNSSGQLGYGNTSNIGDNETPASVSPINLGLGVDAKAVTAGESHTCSLLNNGTVRCWGLNSSGQLGYGNTNTIGDNETAGAAGPVDLGGGLNARGVSAGASHTCATLANGTVRCWGLGTSGQLGYGNTSNIGDNETAGSAGPVDFVDDQPVAVNDFKTFMEDGGAAGIDVLANDTDIDGGPKEVVSKTNGTHGTVAVTAGGAAVTYTAEANYCGSDSFTYTLNGGSTATVSLTITCVDDPPVAVSDSASMTEDASAQVIDVLANDTDIDGGPKSIQSKTEGAHGTVATFGGGLGLLYTPEANYCGEDSFTYELNGASTATVSVSVACVDDPPVAVNDSKTLLEDAGATEVNVLANDTDVDGGPKEVVAETNGTHGTVAITAEGTSIAYTPDANYCGPDSFGYELNGGSKATVSITVSCVDDAPVAVNDSKTLLEDAGPTAIDALANDTDVDGGPKEVASKTNGAYGTIAITGAGTGLTYTPDPNYCGPDSFTYTLSGGSTATVSLTITCIDDLPVAVEDSLTVSEDASATAVDVLANDTDADGGPKQVTAKTNGAHGTVAITGGGAGLTYTPAASYCGPDSFTYTLNGGSQATVSITVTCVDDPPSALNDAATVSEDASVTAIDVLANDTDADGGPRLVQAKTDGAHGTVSIIAAGSGLTYTPQANYCGADFFTYTLNGGSTATVAVTVSCVDDPPTAVGDSETVLQDSPAQAIDVLANDTDPDGGPKAVIGKTNGAHGTVALLGAGAGLTYAPEAGYCGEDSFTYTLSGGSQATVSMTITCVKPSPPTEDSGSGSASSSTTNITAASTGPVVKVTPGVGVLSGRRRPRIAIKGTYAFFTLTCTRKQSDCAGNVKVIATVPAVALGATMKTVVLVRGKFRIGAGRSVLVRARLTRHGLEALEAKRTLRGVSTRMAIEDTRNHERGSIQVNLVRRPKASLLPEPKRPSRKGAGR